MTNKKNRFWTFIFSLIPGAGEMYMGFFKHGISVMALFFLTITFTAFLNIGPFLFLLPIIWFYSFFHVHNLKNMPDEEFYAIEDDFIFPLRGTEYAGLDFSRLFTSYRKPLAIILIIIGATILWNNFMDLLRYILPDFLMNAVWELTYQLPQTIIGILILGLGFYLISGKKKELEQPPKDEDFSTNEYEDSYTNHFGYQKDADLFQEPALPEAPDVENEEKEDKEKPGEGAM